MTVVVVDTGMGNVGSIVNMFRRIGCCAIVSSNSADVEGAERLVLPGVGSYDAAISRLHERGLFAPIDDHVRRKGRPILGICLGLQLFAEGSDEGAFAGFGWIAGRAQRLSGGLGSEGLPIPHMGWNTVVRRRPVSRLTSIGVDARYYFAHSYAVVCRDREDVLAEARYGESFVAAVERDNIVGVQFHPEKSHRYGLALLSDFVNA